MISLGAAAPQYTPVSREALGLRSDIIYVVAVGRLVRRKNLAHLIGALGRLGRDDVHLLVVGDGPERAALEKRAEALCPIVEGLDELESQLALRIDEKPLDIVYKR